MRHGIFLPCRAFFKRAFGSILGAGRSGVYAQSLFKLEPGAENSLDYLRTGDVTVKGRVVDALGTPVAGAGVVSVSSDSDSDSSSSDSDSGSSGSGSGNGNGDGDGGSGGSGNGNGSGAICMTEAEGSFSLDVAQSSISQSALNFAAEKSGYAGGGFRVTLDAPALASLIGSGDVDVGDIDIGLAEPAPSPAFTDGDGNLLGSLSADTLVATLAYRNSGAAARKLSMRVAVYSKDGKLAYIGSDAHEVGADQAYGFAVRLDMPENADGSFAGKGYYVGVFLWDSETFAPAADASYAFR